MECFRSSIYSVFDVRIAYDAALFVVWRPFPSMSQLRNDDTRGSRAYRRIDAQAADWKRLRSTASPLAGIEAFVVGIIASDKSVREKGCMGVGSISEFGNTDTDLVRLRARSGGAQHRALLERLRHAQAANEIGANVDIERAARFVETMMFGLQVSAKAGASLQSLCDTAAFAIASLRKL
jgi:TetR/AcrR family transcriptional regulator, transcriptional repressor for nem operon